MANIPIFEIDPLVCPKFSSTLRLIAFIEDPAMIKMILKHLNLLDVKRKPRPTATPPSIDFFPHMTTNQVLMIISQTWIIPQRPILKLQQGC
jgi:hypothetical protein